MTNPTPHGQAEVMLAASPTPPAEQQAQPDECFPGEPKVAVPQGLIGAACFAIRNKRDGGKVLEQLRRYSVGDRSQPLAPQQAAPKAAPGDVLDEALRERDEAEDFINELLDEVLGADRPEWSSAYNRYDAMSDVRERITALHKPAVDKAWGQFQSAMAAPQQEAQEPVMIYHGRCTIDCGEHGHHDMEMLRMIPSGSKLYTAPQPAPAPLSFDQEARQASAFRPGKESAKPVRASLGATDQSAAVAQEHQPCELFPIARA